MSISNMINSNKFTEIDDIYDDDDFEPSNDFDEGMVISNTTFNSSSKRKRRFNYFSIVLCLILTLFIVFLFSNRCYKYIDTVATDRVNLFNEEGNPNWILLFLQILVIFCIIKLISKY